MAHLSTTTLLIALALAFAPLVAGAEEQSPEQRACITRLLDDTRAAAAVQGRANVTCVREAGKGIVPDVASCLGADVDGKLATALARTTGDALARCAETPPDFGLPAAFEETLNDAAVVHARGIVTDLFGADPDAAIISADVDLDGARCQAQVVRQADALTAARARGFGRCAKRVLEQGGSDATALAACITGDPPDSVATAAERLRRRVRRACAGVATAAAFPGRCATATDLAECVTTRTACRACRLAATSAALDVDCDLGDDATDNDSCRFPVALSGNAIPFIGGPDGRIAGATITIVEDPARQVVTASDGAVLFEDLEEGTEVTLELAHPDYHPIQTGTIRLGASGATRVTFQAVTYPIYDVLAQILQVVPDEANRCQIVTTVTRVGKSIYDPGAHGEDGVTVTIDPALPPEHGPIYFNSSVIPDRTLTETSDDGGVLFIQVPPGEYVWTAHKPGVLLSRIKSKCRVGYLVNASPPWGLQAH